MKTLIYHSEVKEILEEGYDCLILPKAVRIANVPINMRRLETEEGINAGIQDLCDIFGNQFQPVDIIDERFELVRWSFDSDEKEKADFIKILLEQSLARMRQVGQKVQDIDFESLNGNEFLICSRRELKYVKKIEG